MLFWKRVVKVLKNSRPVTLVRLLVSSSAYLSVKMLKSRCLQSVARRKPALQQISFDLSPDPWQFCDGNFLVLRWLPCDPLFHVGSFCCNKFSSILIVNTRVCQMRLIFHVKVCSSFKKFWLNQKDGRGKFPDSDVKNYNDCQNVIIIIQKNKAYITLGHLENTITVWGGIIIIITANTNILLHHHYYW